MGRAENLEGAPLFNAVRAKLTPRGEDDIVDVKFDTFRLLNSLKVQAPERPEAGRRSHSSTSRCASAAGTRATSSCSPWSTETTASRPRAGEGRVRCTLLLLV